MDNNLASILYNDGLYQIPNKENKAIPSIEIIGPKSGKVLCVLDSDTKKNLELLINIMSAVKLSKEDFCWTFEKDWNIIKELGYSCIFDFGNLQFGSIEIRKNEFIQINNQNIISTFTLKALADDREKKKILWKELAGKSF